MTRFLDGPAAGAQLQLTRFPLFLRVVLGTDGKIDALDLLDDEPHEGEAIYAYRRQGKPTSIHIDYTNPKTRRRAAKWLGAAEYKAVTSQPPVGAMLTKDAWQAWCLAERAREVVT